MSAKKVVYDLLATNEQLNAMLARSVLKGSEELPAIYDSWPGENAKMPYMVCSWSFNEGNHWAQVAASLDIDIFTDTGTLDAEEIKNKALELLVWQKIQNETEGIMSIYFGGNDMEIPEQEALITHWNVNFLVKFWRQSLIAAVTNK